MPPPPGYQADDPAVLNNPDDATFGNPDTTFLAAGGFVVVWTDTDDDATQGSNVRAQVFDRSGARIGDDFLVHQAIAGNQAGGRVAALSQGGFVVTWTDAAARQVRAQFFDEAGQKMGAEIQVSATGFPSVSPDIVTLMSGNVAIVWHETEEPNGGWAGSGIRWAEFEPSGARLAGGTVVGYWGQTPHVAALESGGFVVSYTHETNRFSMYPRGMEFTVIEQGIARHGNTTPSPFMPLEQHAIAGLETGGFVLVWAAHTNGSSMAPDTIHGQIFAADRTPVGERFLVSAAGDSNWFQPQIVTVPGVGFAVTWRDAGAGAATADSIRVQFFSNDGVRIGDEFTAHDDPAGFQSHPYIASDGLGSVLVGWVDRQMDGEQYLPSNLLARRFAPIAAEGTRGEDVLAGTAGADMMRAGTGDDSYLVNHEGDRPLERPGEGIDTVFTAISYMLAGNSNIEGLETTDAAGADPLELTGNLVYNRIVGNAGHNRIDGGAGKDEMIGLGGNDNYVVDNEGDRVVEAVGGGIDAVYSSISYTLAEGSEVEGLVASDWGATAALSLTGNGLDNNMIGNAGNNRIDGGGGRDAMVGREGHDTYVVDDQGDVAIEYAGQGGDIVYSSVSYSLSDAYEVESLVTSDWQATVAINLTGNWLNNALIGNAGANQLNGAGGADLMYGREGNDIYIVDNVADQPTETAGEGIDTVYSSISYALAAGTDVEGLATLDWGATAPLGLTGNEIANNVIGNAGANQLDGRAGADVMVGREGHDIYLVDNALDKIFENSAEGYDVIYTGVSFALTNDQELEGLSTINWSATDAIDLTGNAADNYLIGNAGANVLNGGAGNDVLHGREGADTYRFTALLGAGNVDTIFEYSAADDVIALDNNGIFTGLADGALPASAFVIGSAAQDADDRIVYNQATGQLFFDADGSGAGAQVQFALLSGAPAITVSDFIVI